jgi:hypothetical protein
MITKILSRYILFLAGITLSVLFSVPPAPAAEEPSAGIPDIMSAPPAPTSHPLSAGWVDEIQNSLQTYTASYPASNFELYLKRLTLVREAVERGDRRAVKTEMSAFFKMLASRAHGINDIAAEELTNFAQMVAPMEEYGLSVPRSGASPY